MTMSTHSCFASFADDLEPHDLQEAILHHQTQTEFHPDVLHAMQALVDRYSIVCRENARLQAELEQMRVLFQDLRTIIQSWNRPFFFS